MNQQENLMRAFFEQKEEDVAEAERVWDSILKGRGKSFLMESTPTGENSWFKKMWDKTRRERKSPELTRLFPSNQGDQI